MHTPAPAPIEPVSAAKRHGAERSECPRCAYDVSGTIDLWENTCPLEGRCTECGLEFLWRDILSPLYNVPRWSFEHAQHRRLAALFKTTARCFKPASLFRGLRMHHPIIASRLAVFGILSLLFIHCTVAAFFTLEQVTWQVQGNYYGQYPLTTEDLVYGAILPYAAQGFFSTEISEICRGWLPMIALWALIVPMLFPLISTTTSMCKVRRAHFFRAGAYSLVIMTILAVAPLLITSSDSVIALIEATTGSYLDTSSWGFAAIPALGMIVLFLAPIFFWWRAFGTYMRLPHALWVALSFNIIGFLGAGAILYGIVTVFGRRF